MGLLTLSLNVTLDGCVDHQEGIADDETHLGSGKLATELDRLDLIDEYKLLVHPRIAGRGPTLYQGGLPGTRQLELLSAKPLRNGVVAMHYRRARW
ncbi:dihydrofolate reductase family protein [Asanoa sp. NPDC049573]|uniref:dihydrofolate reductase family protein n=1 Tax=Asanoa sp. NPDC049573 TaxID=3155396 RepID=UPI003427590F